MGTAENLNEVTMPKKEFQNVQLQAVQNVGGMKLALNSFAELEKFSHFMALSNFVPKHLRSKQADCLAVLLQSMRWEMDPFAVAQKTYFVNDGMAYEAQLVNAIILSRAPLKARPKLKWSGDADNLKCEVSATFEGEDEPAVFEAEMKSITTRNSPLWKQQPKQQLGYFATRAWARLYCPDVLMGVYTKEEMEDVSNNYGPDNALDITPAAASVLDNIGEQIKAQKLATEAPAPAPAATQREVVDAETGEVTTAKLSLQKWLEEIVNAPTAQGVEHKYSQVLLQYPNDATALASIALVKTERLKVLAAAPKTQPAPAAEPAKVKGLFGRDISSANGAAA